jgi:hypothetical protein
MKKFLQDLNCELFRMKNSVRALVALAVMFGISQKSSAQAIGIFESYAILSYNGASNTYYDMGPQDTGAINFNGTNIGTFGPNNSVVIKGGQNKTFKNNGGNVTGGILFYRIWLTSAGASGSFLPLTMSFVSNDAGDNQTWEGTTGTTNILSGLAFGNYTLEVYSEAPGFPSSAFASNGGANYRATFTYNPITVTSTGGVSPLITYPTLAAAITAINGGTAHTGTIVCSVPSGYAETAPAGGYSITATGTVGAPITFIKSGSGAKPTLTASTANTIGSINDAIFKIIGGDYITIDGFTIQESVNNTTGGATPASATTGNNMTEFGVALFYADATNGAQNNIIQNCTITLNKAYTNTFGIYSTTRHNATGMTGAAEPTSAAGTNSNNKIYSNTISNSNYGIMFTGSGASAAVFDTGNDIGGSATTTGNTISNLGGLIALSGYQSLSGTSYGAVTLNQQINENCSYNTITTGTIASPITVNGILKFYSVASPTAGTITSTINNNTITITNNPTIAATSNGFAIIGINSQNLTPALSTATFSMNNNTIQNCVLGGGTSTTNAFSGLWVNNAAGILNINNNNIIDNSITATTSTSATMFGIFNSTAAAGTLNINSNIIRGFSTTIATVGLRTIYNTGVATIAININNNQLGNATGGLVSYSVAQSATVEGIYNAGGAATAALSITGNDIRGITHAVAAPSAHTYIFNSAATLSQNISSNTFTNLSVNTIGNVTFISNSVNAPAAGFKTINSNSIVTAFNKTGAGGTITLYLDNGSSVSTATHQNNNNNFSNITTGSTTIAGWSNTDGTGSTPNKQITGNTFSNWTCGTSTVTALNVNFGNTTAISNNTIATITGTGIINGIIRGGSGTVAALVMANNSITGLSSTGTGGAVTGISNAISSTTQAIINNNIINNLSSTSTTAAVTGITTSTSTNVFSNTINTLSCVGTSSGGTTGIAVTGGTSHNIFKNKIYDLSTSGTFTTLGAVNAIVLSGAVSNVTSNVYNNTIGELKATSANSVNAIRAISLIATGTTSTYRVYHNSVLLSGTSIGTNFGTSGIFHQTNSVATTGSLDLRNNIIINNSVSTGSGFTVAYRRSDLTLANYATTSNNNLFYAGVPSAFNLIYYDSTNSDQTLSAFQTRMSTRDGASQSENIAFVSAVGSNANFLKIAANTTTYAESGASPITTPLINDDYFGVARPFSPATPANNSVSGTVDIGASEFDGIPAAIPCLTPGNQPTALTFSAITTTSMSGSFTAATPSVPTSYIVVRSTASTLSANPVDGTTYTAGASLGGGTVIIPTGTTFTSTGLTAGTLYYYFVMSVNSGVCTSGPKYLTATPLTSSQATLCSPATALALVANTTNPSGATLSWTGAGNYIVEYGPAGYTAGTGATAGATGTIASSAATTPYVLTGLTAGTSYDVYIRQVCALGGLYSANATKVTFTPTCAGIPTGLVSSAITTTTSTISWTASSPIPASGYEYFVSTSATTPLANATPSGNTAAGVLTANLTLLAAGTNYYYWIRSNCDGTNKGTWSASGIFKTVCLTSAIPLLEGFNSSTIPNCWSSQIVLLQSGTKISYPTSGSSPTTSPQEGSNMVQYNSFSTINGGAGSEERLVTPIMSSTGISSVDVEFNWRNENNSTYSAGNYLNEGVQIQYSIDGGTSWINTGSLIARHDASLTVGTAVWNKKTVTLPAGASNQASLLVGFKFRSEFGDNQFLDNVNIKITPEPIVITPTNAAICNGTSTTLVASSTNTGYVYTWSPSTGLSTTTGATVTASPITTTTYTITGLESATTKTTTQTVLVTVNPNPITPTVTPTSATVCVGNVTTLTATSLIGSSGTTLIGVQSGTTSTAAITPYRLAVSTASRNQYLYTKAELNAAGINGAQNITSLAFDITNTSGFSNMNNYEISLANTTSTGVASNYSYIGGAFAIVYSGNNITPSTGLNSYTFSTPFAWDGTSNIIINVCLTAGTVGTSLSVKAMASVTPVGSVGNSGTGVCTSTTGATTNGIRPLITLGYNSVVNNPITWTPITGLFTDPAATTTPYITGSAATTVYAKPSTTAAYTATATLGTCTKTSTSVITVTPTSIGGTVSATQTICSGDTPTALTLSGITGTVTKWQSSLDNFASAGTDIANTTSTLTLGALTATTYYRAVVQSGVCATANSNIVTITVTPNTFSDTTVSECDTYTWATNGATYITSGTYLGTKVGCVTPRLFLTITPTIIPTFTQVAPICIGDNFVLPNTSLNGILGAWSPAINNTLTTLYTFTPSSTCATTATMTVTVGGLKTWNAGWTPLGAPTSIDSVLINGNYTASTDGGTINACSLTVDNNAIVLIDNNANINLQGKLTVISGSVTINNNSNLIQTQNIANSGDITIKRNSSALFRLDYTQWSSPVTGPKTLVQFTPQTSQFSASPPVTSRFYVYNSLTNTYNNAFNPATTTFDIGKGYHLRMPNNWVAAPLPAAKYTGVFTGVPNNGPQTITMSNTGAGLGFNLIGNPYPSDIQMSSFVAANSSSITGTLYFWRKTNNALAPSYSTWTAGTFNQGTTTATDPNGIISVGQGFIVEAASGQTNLTFNNSMRIADNVDHFFRAPNTIDYNRIWLNATNASGAFCQTTVGYMTGSTAAVDSFDGLFFNDGDINLTSLIGTNKYAIQGRQYPFDSTDIVPMSFKATTAGNYNIAIDHVDGLFSGFSNIYLRDNLTGTVNNLTTSNYSFAANAGTDNSRFEVLYSLPLSNNNVTFNDNNVIVYKNNETININSGSQTMNNVKIYDIRGRLLIEKTNINASQIAINSSTIGNQVLVIQITSDTNIKVNKKIVN